MKWKLWTRNENIMPATTESEQHDSKGPEAIRRLVELGLKAKK
jgi:hypothetical protein